MPTSAPRINITQFAWLAQRFAWPEPPKAVHTLSGGPATFSPSAEDVGDHQVLILQDGSLCLGSWTNSGEGGFRIGVAGVTQQQPITGLQRSNLTQVIAVLQEQFPSLLMRHIHTGDNPTTGIGLTSVTLRREVKSMRASAGYRTLQLALAEFDDKSPQGLATAALLQSLTESRKDTAMNNATDLVDLDPALAASRELDLKKLTPEQIALLKRHVVNLRHGKLNSGGPFSTSEKDVDAIFDVHLAEALAKAKKANRKLKILLWAHGGLVPESAALDHVLNHYKQWLSVDIYPIYFVWETDFWTSLKSKLGWDKEERGFWGNLFAAPTDWALEKAAYIPGNAIWGQMKQYAADAVKADGGARYAARKLAAFMKAGDAGKHTELYAIGHSAGSNFMSWFLPTALEAGVSGFKELFLLAPAITTFEFNERLATHIGNSIGRSTIFTMNEEAELDDNCFQVYRKSLLYFISRAFEPKVPTPLLGLEESLRASKPLRKLYGLDAPSKIGEVIFSPNNEYGGSSASKSTTHGGFDNDHLTLNSMACRILGKKVAPFEKETQRGFSPPVAPPAAVTRGDLRTPVRRALCIGIDAYASKPLSGCINDARLWKQELEGLGFDVGLLTDDQATRAGILHGIQQLLQGSAEGDVLALQYSGHGTRVPDVNGDERDGTDEALVPFDYEDGNLIIDDDLGLILDSIPSGVNFTLFMDCCHSGTNTRVFGFSPRGARGGEKERYMTMPKEALERYLVVRQDQPALPPNPYAKKLEILFAACRPDQTAKESDGHGYFTRTAVPLLRLSKDGIDHATFLKKVVEGFPLSADSQLPQLDCDDPQRLGLLFGSAAPRAEPAGEPVKTAAGVEAAMLIETMRDYMKLLNRLL